MNQENASTTPSAPAVDRAAPCSSIVRFKTRHNQSGIMCDGWGSLNVEQETVLFDAEDFGLIDSCHWNIQKQGDGFVCSGPSRGCISSGGVLMHRMILGVTDLKLIAQHINGDVLDNRKENLIKKSRATLNLEREKPMNLIDPFGEPVGINEIIHRSKGIAYRQVRAEIIVNGVRKTKVFSISKYGREGAMKMAADWRLSEMWNCDGMPMERAFTWFLDWDVADPRGKVYCPN